MIAFWFRRDLRIQDNAALVSAAKAASGSDLVAFYWIRPREFEKLSGIRQHSLIESLRALSESLNNRLSIISADRPQDVVQSLLKAKIDRVFATNAFDPEGISEQRSLETQLKKQAIEVELADSNYAVKPGTVKKPVDGSPYRVYTPFYRAWLTVGWEKPYRLPAISLKKLAGSNIPKPSKSAPFRVRAGEQFALDTLKRFKRRAIASYHENRNRADLSGTSKLSHALAHGEIHPRTILATLGQSAGEEVFRKEIAWREFYADVLYHNPSSLYDYLEPRFKQMRYDSGKTASAKFEAWKMGRTGFPMVDAGMRQLATEGWMHNRVRMIVASFLVKDLHLEWQLGAQWFEENLSDYDPASNSHGWQWTAGCGTDASPYYRVFNPILQGYKFDPNGDYVRKFIPELRHIEGAAVHEPWLLVDGLSAGYPEPMLDHSQERDESLRRLEEIKVK